MNLTVRVNKMTIGILEMLAGASMLYMGWKNLWFRTTGYASIKELRTITWGLLCLGVGYCLILWSMNEINPQITL